MWSTSMVMQAMVLRAVPLKVRRGESAVIKNTSFSLQKIVTGTITKEGGVSCRNRGKICTERAKNRGKNA